MLEIQRRTRDELEARRPMLYEGLEPVNYKSHKKLLRSLSSYRAAMLVKIWSGAILTARHKATISPQHSLACACGHERETLSHLLYDCPLSPALPPELARWKEKPRATSAGKCWITRKTRDSKFVAVQRCTDEAGCPC